MHDALDVEITFGQYRGATWRQVWDRGDFSYIRWAVEEADQLDDDMKDLLWEALDNEFGWDTEAMPADLAWGSD